MKVLCIYHGGCDDGFAAAWCIRRALGNDVEFYPGVYQEEPPPHDGRDVIFVDFSYKRPILEKMAKAAKSILILDHHKTAQEDLADINAPPSFDIWRQAAWNGKPAENVRICALFDMERSGASLAWDYFLGGKRPEFIDYIEDRDLWRKKLPHGDEFAIALRSYPQDFAVWDRLVERGPAALIGEGSPIQRYYRLRVEEFKEGACRAILGGHACLIANAPPFAASEVAGELADRGVTEFGACFFEPEAGRWKYELRSRGNFDVSAVATRFGGGGHRNAAGFTADRLVHNIQDGGGNRIGAWIAGRSHSMAKIVQRFEQMIEVSGGGEGPPTQHAAPTDKEKIDWLYGVLTILDGKAGALLAFDGLLLAAEALMYEKMSEQAHWLQLPSLLLILLTLVAALLCLYVARVSYPFLGEIKPQIRSNAAEINGLGTVIEDRTSLLGLAWRFSLAALWFFSALVLVVFFVFLIDLLKEIP